MTDDLFPSPKSRLSTQMFAFFLGVFGAHRFYVGKVQSGLLMLFTFGGLGVWWLYDNIAILTGTFRDADGLLVSNWEQETDRIVPASSGAALLDELDQLRADVNELQERVDFAERLLADPERGERRTP